MRLLPITGREELATAPSDPGAARALLGQLVCADASGAPVDPGSLTVSDADRLLAALHQLLYGDRAECRVQCVACNEPFEFTLLISELIQAQDAERGEPPGPDGSWVLPGGTRLRPPRVADLEAADSPAALLETLVVGGGPIEPAVASAFLERAAPVLALDLDAACPACSATANVRFDIGRFLVARLAGERTFLLREAHLIASRYGWSHQEIMSLPREERRAYAGYIDADRSAVGARGMAR